MIINGEKGFTLIEVMVVITLIGVLATFVINNYLNARGKAMDVAAVKTLQAMKTALEVYRSETGAYPTASTVASMQNDLNQTGDMPSHITLTDSTDIAPASGTLTAYAGRVTTYQITAIGRDTLHYFQLTNAGVLTGPNSTATATIPK